MLNLDCTPNPPPTRPVLVLDEDGFLVDRESWNRGNAQALAVLNGVGELTPSHWSLIRYIRDYHERFGSVPLMRRVCRAQNLNRDSVKTLFGGCLEAWKIAGLPNPGEEAKAYMA